MRGVNDKIIPMRQPPGAEPKCAFCGKPKSKVRILIESNSGTRICNECVVAAKKRISE